MPMLAELLGERFAERFPKEVLEAAHERCRELLAEYDEPGRVKRLCPESREPGFKPSLAPGFGPAAGLGYRYFFVRHGGRVRPRLEVNFLVALAALGYEHAFEEALELMSLRRRVPADFTHMLSEDYGSLPEEVHLCARTVGPQMLEWWRNWWLLRKAERDPG